MENLKKLLLSIRFVGLENTFRMVRYSLFRDSIERRYPSPVIKGEPSPVGKVKASEPFNSGALLHFERASLELRFLAPDVLRVSWEPGDPPPPYALANSDWPEIAVESNSRDEGWEVSTETMRASVSSEGEIRFFDASGGLLRHDLPPLVKTGGDDGIASSWTHRASLAPEERVYGLGEQAGPLNLRPGEYILWNTDPGGSYEPGDGPLYMPMPVYFGLHRRGTYLVFFENTYSGEISLAQMGEDGIAEISFTEGMLRYYFLPGPPERALSRFSTLTGNTPLPPRWALGYHQSRWGYKSEAEVREIADGFRERGIPLSSIHLDIDYMDDYRVFTVDTEDFPDLGSLSEHLRTEEVRLVTILDPGVKQDPNYEVYRSGLEENAFALLPDGGPAVGLVWPGWSLFPDFTDPDARAWWGEHYRLLLDSGIAGIWHDMNEPSCFSGWGGLTLPLPTRHRLEGENGDHRKAHNVYGLQMNRAGYDAQRRLAPERRPWQLSRSGWVGLQRYAWNWTGDTGSSWGALAMTVPTVLGLGLSGIPYSGPDVGGFSGNPDAELYIRWLQLAAFLPFFRTHAAVGTERREPWSYGEEHTGIARETIQLRYAMLPYWYTLAWETCQHGLPIVRPLWWSDPQDERLWDDAEAFLVGDALLAAPVLQKGAREKEINLPSGSWYHYWDNVLLHGPGHVQLDAPLERIPILVRCGSLLPLEENKTSLVLHLYLPEDGQEVENSLYTDAGDGYGEWRLDRFRVTRSGDQVDITHAVEGERAFPSQELTLAVHGAQIDRTTMDGKEPPADENRASLQPEFQHIQLKIKASG